MSQSKTKNSSLVRLIYKKKSRTLHVWYTAEGATRPPSPPPRLLLLSKMWLLNHYIFPSQYASGSCAMAIPSNM